MSIPPTFPAGKDWLLQSFTEFYKDLSSVPSVPAEVNTKKKQYNSARTRKRHTHCWQALAPVHCTLAPAFMKLSWNLPGASQGSSNFYQWDPATSRPGACHEMPWDAMRGRVSHSWQAHAHGALRLLTRKARQAGQYYTVLTYFPISGMIFTNRIHNCSGFVQEEAERPST